MREFDCIIQTQNCVGGHVSLSWYSWYSGWLWPSMCYSHCWQNLGSLVTSLRKKKTWIFGNMTKWQVLSSIIVNGVKWLWNPSESFVIYFCGPEDAQRCIPSILTNKNVLLICLFRHNLPTENKGLCSFKKLSL